MVVFTCQHCNASLKRVAVAKHYSQACRNNTPYLTCIDCLKDFRGNDYNAHMTCVTEDERYGDKNFVAKKTGVKQTEWIDIVHMCAEKNKNPKFNFIFSKLASYQNVPRKKPKFLNFIKSSLPKFSQDIAVEVFHIIDEEFTKQKKKDSENITNGSNGVKNNDENLSDVKESTVKGDEKKKKKKRNRNSESDAVPAEDNDIKSPAEEKPKKKKKNKLNNKHKSSTVEQEELESPEDTTRVKKKKDKKKNDCLNETSESVDVEENYSMNNQNGNHEEPNESVNHTKLSKKELKKLKKKQKYDAELKNIEESESTKEVEFKTDENEQESIKPSKKQKKRKANANESENGTGKKQKVEASLEPEDFSFDNNEEEEKQQKGNVRFNWEEIIKEVLRKNPDHEMSLKKISKKVLAEYQAIKGERESYEELISKFNKKINKTVGVRVLKDKAKLLPED